MAMAARRVRNRGSGLVLAGLGAVFLLAYFLVPVPAFDELEQRRGIVEEARRDRITPCRRSASDCLHTVVVVRHGADSRSYNFAQADVGSIASGVEIVLWVAPAIRGLDGERVWQAEQSGEVVLDYEGQARTDRRIIWILVPLAPFLVAGGYWMARRYDWSGNRVGA